MKIKSTGFALLLMLTALGTATIATGCDGDDPPHTPDLTIAPGEILDIPAEGGKYKITITSNEAWTISDIPQWASFDTTIGQDNLEVTLTVLPTDLTEVRRHVVKIESENVKKTLTLEQSAKTDTPELQNQYRFDGVTYDINIAEQQYYAKRYHPDAEGLNIDLYLLTGTMEAVTSGIYLELFYSEGETLPKGEYVFSENKKPGTLYYGEVFLSEEEFYWFTGGTVSVSLSGERYTVIIDAVCENGKELKAHYEGVMDYYDNTESDWDSWMMPDDGILAYGDKEYEILDIWQTYYGDYFEAGYPNIDLGIFAFCEVDDEPEEVELNFPMIVPAGATALVGGTYSLSPDIAPMNLLGGIIWLGERSYFNYINSGRIKLNLQAEEYEVMITCLFEGNIPVRAYYTGKVWWYDESDFGGYVSRKAPAITTYIQEFKAPKQRLYR